MSTLVLTGYDNGDFEPIGDKTTPGKRAWAARNGYEFECVRTYAPGSHPSWQKLGLVEERLRDYSEIVWLDADTVITNPTITVPCFVGHKESALVVSRDWGFCDEKDQSFHFSMGNFLVRNIPPAFSLIEAAKGHEEFENSGLWEQSAVQQAVRENQRLQDALAILPRRVLNAVPDDVQCTAPEPWQKGDFLAHLTGTSHCIRAAVIDKYNLEHVNATLKASQYGIDNWDTCIAMDKRHTACLRDILIGKQWNSTLEIGCHHGCSSIAFVEGLNRGTVMHAHFADIHIQSVFRNVISNTLEPSKVTLHECTGQEVMAKKASHFDLVFVDGNHTLPVVKRETREILRIMPECVVAHDINSQFVGFPECDGPPFLLRELQSAGYLCLVDLQDRPREMTKRGLVIACKSEETYRVALAGFRANCW